MVIHNNNAFVFSIIEHKLCQTLIEHVAGEKLQSSMVTR